MFTGNAAVPQAYADYPGLFVVGDSRGNFTLNLFGIVAKKPKHVLYEIPEI
jgi:hypothetical protein